MRYAGQAPGQYSLPHIKDQADFKNPEIQQKYKDGPVGFVTIVPSGLPNMGPNLIMMALYNLLIAVLCAYFVSRTAPPGADYMAIFRISSAVAFIAYGMAYVQESIWFGRPWSSTMKTFLRCSNLCRPDRRHVRLADVRKLPPARHICSPESPDAAAITWLMAMLFSDKGDTNGYQSSNVGRLGRVFCEQKLSAFAGAGARS